ncbi:MAG: alpha/beta hydrolase [Litoreibacter sp.]|nr:alpha/beta hydrolase [Litoreibacter sp.]
MTLSYWDSQFNFRNVLPDFEDYLANMTARSAQCAIQFELVQYGDHPRQLVELTGTPERVLPVFIHGGYWRALTAQMHRFVLPHFAQEHGAVANLEYRLLPEVALADIVDDALAGLKAIADKTGTRLMVIGHSAGGHLAVMNALRLPDIVCSAVSISGLYDLTPLPWTFLREEVGLTAADIEGQSPLAVWDAGPADHILVVVGEKETAEFHRQAQVFASMHGARTFTALGAHHMTVLDALSDPTSPLNAEIRSRMQNIK